MPWIYPSLLWRMPAGEPALYLTFDDGPVNGPTDFVLEELQKANAKATFFCIGDNVRKHPDVFNKVLADRHAIGNHTFNHLNGWRTPLQSYLENVQKCEAQINSAGSYDCQLFRPPYGRITLKQVTALKEKYRIIMWDVLTRDFDKTLSSETCLKRSVEAVRPGSVIVFHDSYKAEKNLMYTLPRLIGHFSDKGYSFKSLLL